MALTRRMQHFGVLHYNLEGRSVLKELRRVHGCSAAQVQLEKKKLLANPSATNTCLKCVSRAQRCSTEPF